MDLDNEIEPAEIPCLRVQQIELGSLAIHDEQTLRGAPELCR